MISRGTQTSRWSLLYSGTKYVFWSIFDPLKDSLSLLYNKWVIAPSAGLYFADQITKFPSWITSKVKNEVEGVEGSLYMRWSEQDQAIKKYLVDCTILNSSKECHSEKNVTDSSVDYRVNFHTFSSFVAHNNLPEYMIPSARYIYSFFSQESSGLYGKIDEATKEFESNNYLPMLQFVRSGCEYSNSIVQIIRDVAVFLDSKLGLGEEFLERFKRCPDNADKEDFESYISVMTKLAALTINEDYDQTLDALHYLEELIADYKGDDTRELSTEIKYQKLRCMFHYKAGSYQTAAYYQKIAVDTGELQKSSDKSQIRYWEMQRLHDIAMRKKHFIECAETRKCKAEYIETKHQKLHASFNETLEKLTKIVLEDEKYEHDVNHDQNVIKENIVKIYIDRAEILENSTYLQEAYDQAKSFFKFGDITIHTSEELNVICTLSRIIYVEAKLGVSELSKDVYDWVGSYLNEHREVLPNNATNNVEMALNLYKVVGEINGVIHPSLLITKKVGYYIQELELMQNNSESIEVKSSGDIGPTGSDVKSIEVKTSGDIGPTDAAEEW